MMPDPERGKARIEMVGEVPTWSGSNAQRAQEWAHNGFDLGPKCPKMGQAGATMEPTWSQGGPKMSPRWPTYAQE